MRSHSKRTFPQAHSNKQLNLQVQPVHLLLVLNHIYVELIQNLGSQFDDLEFVIPSPQSVFSYLKQMVAKYKLDVKILAESEMSVEDFNLLKLSLFQLSSIAINTSGSVALELARAGTPMISVYKCGWFFERILKTPLNVYWPTTGSSKISKLFESER